jgi:BirA family biotin operon repressor/biotin-[acetyl-CoA-carboxylase] ligase
MTNLEVEIILKLKASDRFITRDELGRACGAPTAEIERALGELIERGYRIDQVPGEGYRFIGGPDMLDGSDIRAGLRTSLIGSEIVTFGRVGSTNDIAGALARGGAAEGTVVVAEEQSRGRGRLGRSWHSPAGCGLWLSIVLRPTLTPDDSTTVSLAGALGVATALENHYGIAARLKWPNDVLVGTRKICGILTEGEFIGPQVSFIIVGIGINILNRESDFPPEIRDIATSVRIETGRSVARSEVLLHILEGIEARYGVLCRDGFGAIRRDLLAHSVLLGRMVKVATGTGTIEGIAQDIDESGALIVRKDSGTLERIIAGEVVGII